MADHVRIIAIFNLAWGALILFGVTQFFLFVDAPPLWVQIAATVLALLSIPAILGGIGLLQRRRWGRIFALVTAAVSLLSIPIGTAFGIYSIVILKKPEIAATLT